MLEGLAWVHKTHRGFCVTFARELDDTEMLSRFVDDPSRAELVPDLVEDEALREEIEAEEEDALLEGRLVHVGSCGGWGFALEDGSDFYAGTRPEVLCRVSVGTVAIAIAQASWNGRITCGYAENGVLIAKWHDRALSDCFEDGEDPSRILTMVQDMHNDEQSAWEEAAALVEAIGVRLDRESVAEKPLFRTWVSE